MKNVVYILAFCFLLEWAYTTKIKPFIIAEFGLDPGKKTNGDTDSTGGGGNTLPSTGNYTYGLDISKYQGAEMEIPFGKKDSVSFVICKATQGIDGKDSTFQRNWQEILNKKFIRGGYHLYESDDDATKQANHYYSVMGKLSINDFPPIIDVEEAGINFIRSVSAIKDTLLVFLAKVAALYKCTPMIYTDFNIASKYMNDPAFAAYPLWYARYKSEGPGPLPGAWKGQKWTMWQKSAHYYFNSRANDFDVFNGPVDSLKIFIEKYH